VDRAIQNGDEPPADGATRRDFLRLTTALGLSVWFSPGCLALRLDAADDLESPRNPTWTGRLRPREVHDLWSLFDYIGSAWGSAGFCTIASEGALRPILDQKTGLSPSYLTEYRRAVKTFRQLQDQFGQEEALRRFFFVVDDPFLRRYVVLELLTLQVAFGGFRRFGYKNYAGFMGGSFDDREHLPYRTISDSPTA
jgi:hypothetical protein